MLKFLKFHLNKSPSPFKIIHFNRKFLEKNTEGGFPYKSEVKSASTNHQKNQPAVQLFLFSWIH